MDAEALTPLYTGAEVRQAEAPLLEAGEGPQLMARAAWGLAGEVAVQLRHRRGRIYGTRVTGLIGPGNNGGDGLFALALLRRRGVDARAVLVSDRAHDQGLAAFRQAGGRLTQSIDADVDVLIDAVIGTGTSGGFALPQVPGLTEALARESTAVVACDAPSGVDPGTGAVAQEVIAADLTVTFGGHKLGLMVGAGAQASGRVVVVDIGMAGELARFRAEAARSRSVVAAEPVTPAPRRQDHKYSRGVAHVVAGSHRYPGAAVLSVRAAVQTGCGMVTLYAPGPVVSLVTAAQPEIVGTTAPEIPPRATAVAVGPGIAEDPGQCAALDCALEWAQRTGGRLVLDASALTLLAERGEQLTAQLPASTVLTPHLGELRALMEAAGRKDLCEELEASPVTAVEDFAGYLGCTVLLKGASTIIAEPRSRTLVHRVQAPGLATAGSGDVLTGVLVALAATAGPKVPLAEIAATAVRRHGQAACRLDPQGRGGFGASALIEACNGAAIRASAGTFD